MADIEANITPVCSFAQSSCLETPVGRIYADITPVCSFARNSCLEVFKINIVGAYTQPIVAIVERGL